MNSKCMYCEEGEHCRMCECGKECEHIIGWHQSDGYVTEDSPDWLKAVYFEFKYCPLCGEKL